MVRYVVYLQVAMFSRAVRIQRAKCNPQVFRSGFTRCVVARPDVKGRVLSGWAGAPGHFSGHLCGIAVCHACNKVDDSHKRSMQWPLWVRGVASQQVQDAAVFE